MLIFVHGTLRKGLALSHVLDKSLYVGTARLRSPNSIMVGLSKTSYPAIVPVRPGWLIRDSGGAPIQYALGEVYEVSRGVLATLDEIEGIPVFYQRLEGMVQLSKEMASTLNKAALENGGRGWRSGGAGVLLYGMHADSKWLEQGIVVANGDWVKPEWGESFREYRARHRFADAEAAIAHEQGQPPRQMGRPRRMFAETDIVEAADFVDLAQMADEIEDAEDEEHEEF